MSTPAVGSSRISSRGRCMSARARVIRRFMPPERKRVRSWRLSVSEKISSSSVARALRSRLGIPK